jgi:hypothetical protein
MIAKSKGEMNNEELIHEWEYIEGLSILYLYIFQISSVIIFPNIQSSYKGVN